MSRRRICELIPHMKESLSAKGTNIEMDVVLPLASDLSVGPHVIT
jgi:hypothetical protein